MTTSTKGWTSGLLGVLIFSGSLPATRVAVMNLSPLFLTSARAVMAALLAAALLIGLKERKPARSDLLPLAIVAAGVVIGFPLLTALALQHITSAHSLIFIGLLPLATALFGVLRGGEKPRPAFWIFSILGACSVVGFALGRGGEASFAGDSLMVAAVILCGLGYAEGATLSRRLGGWQVISWALVLALPVMMVPALLTLPHQWGAVGCPAWIGLGYVSVFSMLVGFVFWYRGLALGGIAKVGQLQLLQPFFGLVLAHLFLNEPVSWGLVIVTLAVVACVTCAKRFA